MDFMSSIANFFANAALAGVNGANQLEIVPTIIENLQHPALSWLTSLLGGVENAVYQLLLLLLAFGGTQDPSAIKLYISQRGVAEMAPLSMSTPPLSGNITYFIIHGFTQKYDTGIYVNLTKELVNRKENDHVVINVDWSEYAAGPNYLRAVGSIELVGKTLANYILASNMDPSRIRIVGHSLGAHVAGFVGKHLKAKGALLKSIMALDPAGPLFGILAPVPTNSRLATGDASFVITLQTNRGVLGNNFALGKVNFWANDGTHQPGCHDENDNDLTCCHERSVYLYYYSLLCNKFIGFNEENGDTLVYGFRIPTDAQGIYKFNTTAVPPFTLDGSLV